MKPQIEATADGEDVVIRVNAGDAERIAHALTRHARTSTFAPDYDYMAEVIDIAARQAYWT